jgi:hypothetical protein
MILFYYFFEILFFFILFFEEIFFGRVLLIYKRLNFLFFCEKYFLNNCIIVCSDILLHENNFWKGNN